MNPPSPELLSGSLATFRIEVESRPIADTFQVVAIETLLAVNRLPKAKLVLYDGNPADGNFPISNVDIFLPGNQITIAAGYDGTNTLIFSGIITGQSIEINQTASSRLVVEIADKAMAMTLTRSNAVFTNIKDSDLMQKLISGNGLTASVSATQTVYEDIVQYYATDWDLMVMRAELNGFVVIANGGKVTVEPPNTQSAPVLLVEYGSSIFDLEAEMDAATQYKSSAIQSYSWDPASQKLLSSGPGPVQVTEPGNVSSDTLADTFNIAVFGQQTGATIPAASLQEWSSAELLRSKLSKIRGQVRFQGSALAQPGKMIQLAGLGNRFNGAAYISGVSHVISNGLWSTTVTFGLAWPWFSAEASRIPAPGASGQLPPIQGLQTAKVKAISADPGGEYRVQVTIPILGDGSQAVWARLSTFYASNKIGAVFYPEVGDEVVIGFMNNDSRSPVILGSVYSKPLQPPYPPDANNIKKAIVTRSKLELTFDDQNKIVEIKTPENRTIRMDDNGGTITISDSNKNTITMSSSGITVDSSKDLVLKAAGNVTVTAGAALTMSAATNATLKAAQVTNTASGSFQAQGGTATLTASGITTIKGMMVNIN